MEQLEEGFNTACANGVIPGAALACTNASGSFSYVRSFGVRSLDEKEDTAIDADTILTLTSCTKIVTSIAVLQIIERGLIGLDDEIDNVLPELAALKILIAMENGEPRFADRQRPMTLRRLLSHSSGLVYFHMSPLLHAYVASLGKPVSPTTVIDSFSTPLIYEPGTSWSYGPGLDWAGLAVARLMKMPLEDYLQQYIFAPLDITDMTFWPDKTPELKAKKATLAMRASDGSGKSVPFTGPDPVAGAKEELAGQGLFASANSYLKVLRSVLADDEALLKRMSTALMFEPQLTTESQGVLQAYYESKPERGPCAVGEFPPELPYQWGIGGLLSLDDRQKDGVVVRRRGCMNWSGMLNLFWWIDRTADICGIFGVQIIPSGDLKVRQLISLFETTMYEQSALQAGNRIL